jgi:hypothetical protein
MYGFNITLTDSFDNTVKRVTEALKTGFDARLSRFASCGARREDGPLDRLLLSASPLARTPFGAR